MDDPTPSECMVSTNGLGGLRGCEVGWEVVGDLRKAGSRD